ncbi:MAG: hypothetical protein JOY58_17180, partial [Solirubrobacterales bacterium]|nr:hypothetical protein [Solirubrobacterales bacterium]
QKHPQFDVICQQLDEFEPLPSIIPAEVELAEDEREVRSEDPAPLDGMILAGLVSP